MRMLKAQLLLAVVIIVVYMLFPVNHLLGSTQLAASPPIQTPIQTEPQVVSYVQENSYDSSAATRNEAAPTHNAPTPRRTYGTKCVGKTFDKQPFYGTANVYSRKGSLKIEEMWKDTVPTLKLRTQARTLQMCNLSVPENANAVLAAKSLEKTVGFLAAASRLLLSPDSLTDPRAALERAFPGTQTRTQTQTLTHTDSNQWAPDAPSCTKSVNLAFFMTSQVGAPLIRGFMTADMVKQAGHGSVVVLAKRGAWNPNPLKEFESCRRIDACIFVKWYNRAFPQLVHECRKRGAAVFVDLLDYCNTHIKNVIDRFPQGVTGFLAQSAWQASYFRALGYPRSIMLQHPQTNFDKRHSTGARNVTTIGYTGHWRNLGAANQKIFDAIAEWGKPRGVSFKSINYYEFNNVQKGTSDVFKQAVYHQAVDDIDVAIIWPQEEDNDMEVYFKPVTRLIYWLSHGIPCIFYPTQSYAEFADALGYPLVAKTLDDVEKWLEILVENKEFRMYVSALGLRGAQQRSARATADLYVDAMCEYAENGTKADLVKERILSHYSSPK